MNDRPRAGVDLEHKIEQVIQEHLAEHGGGFLGSWFMVANFTDDEGAPAWLYKTAPGQQQVDTAGLIAWAEGIARYEQHRYLEELEAGGD